MRRTSLNELMTRRIARAIGLGTILLPVAYSCGGNVVVEDGSGGDSASSTTNNTVSTNASTDGSSTNNGSSASNTQASTVTTGGGCTETTTVSSGSGQSLSHYTMCLDDLNIPCPQNEDAAFDTIATLLNQECCVQTDACEYLLDVVCGPYASMGDTCCFEIQTQDDGCIVPGRPYMVADAPVTAPAARGDSWLRDPCAVPDDLDANERAALSAMWTEHALAEHASVASFAQLSLELMALGAPAQLLQDTHRAALDEIRHAQLAFELASSLAGEPIAPGALPLHQTEATPTLATLAAATVAEGCVNETLSALLLGAQLEHATDPTVRQALRVMLADETRHAELAWRTVAWALREGGEDVRQAVERAFANATTPTLSEAPGLTASARIHAPLPAPEQAQQLMQQALRDVVQPCAAALLADTAQPAPAQSKANAPTLHAV